MPLLVFGVTYFVAASVYVVVVALAEGERAFFKTVLPGMLPLLGILFAVLSRLPFRTAIPGLNRIAAWERALSYPRHSQRAACGQTDENRYCRNTRGRPPMAEIFADALVQLIVTTALNLCAMAR